MKYNWSVQQTGASQSALAFNPADTSVFLAGTVGPNLVIRLDTPIASVLLAKPGAAFTISLAVASSFGSGTAAAILAMPAPPSGGICRVSPQTGVPLKTQFVVHCKDWSCDTLPLSYSFSTRSLEIAVASDPAVSWSSPTAKKLNIEQQAEGVVKNPLGQAMSGVKTILSGAAQVGLGVWGSRTLGKLISVAGGGGKGFLGRGLGSLGGLARGALGSLGSAGAWLGRGALGTGEAILGSAALPLTGAVGTGIGVGYGFDKLFPNNPLAKLGGKIADWSAPDETAMPTPFDTNAYRKAHGIDINGAHQMTGVGVKTNDIDKLSDSKAVTPAGDTVGDLLSTLVTQMNKMIDINSKQLDLTDDTHKEYMDWLVKQSTDTRVKNAENQGRNTVMGGH